MLVFNNIDDLQKYLSPFSDEINIGFVPTMGALHEGHLSLINKASEDNDVVVVSIFVNPTQFDKAEDLEKYPRTLEKDIELLNTVKCDVLFTPNASEIYNENINSETFDFDGLENVMEGEFRIGHFDGVGTIVKKLFEIVKPANAYFGEKDFQQLQIIKKMVAKTQLPVNIIGCEIYRENDGLAMSSRNELLTKEQRDAAPFIYKTLKTVKNSFEKKTIKETSFWVQNEFKNHPSLKLEYFQIADESSLKEAETKNNRKKYRGFIAVFAGNIRLIDNIQL